MRFSSTAAAFLTAAVLVATAAQGQQDCVSGLVTCYADLNATTPSKACCNALKSAVATQLTCLCELFLNPPAMQGINMTQAMLLPTHCGLTINPSACAAAANAPTGSSSETPPGVTGRDGNGASMRSWIGVPTLLVVSALAFLC